MTGLLAEHEPAENAHQRHDALDGEEKRRIDDFLATLGHELRNPLSAIQYALAVWPHVKDDPTQMNELHNVLQRQVRELTHLSDDLLDVARIARGKLALHREQIGLRELIDGAVEQVRPLIERRGHALTVQLPAEPVVVYADPSRLLQVFANLIQNAAKFMNRNGSLRINVESQNGMAMVRVRDDGPGIEAHMLRSIFEAFTQVESAPTSANDGMGIGLRHVKSIVELHGGAVTALSDGLGHGSEFTVRLPSLPTRNGCSRPGAGSAS